MILRVGLDARLHCPHFEIAQYHRDFLAYTRATTATLEMIRWKTNIHASLLQEVEGVDEVSFRIDIESTIENKLVFGTLKGEVGVSTKVHRREI